MTSRLLCLALLAAPALALAEPTQPAPPPATPEIEAGLAAYDNGDYARACLALAGARAAATTPPDQKTRVLRYLGACHHVQGHLESAREAFQTLLRLDPSAELDPVAFPPEMVSFFRDVKAAMPAPPKAVVAPSAAASATPAPPQGEHRSRLVAALPFGAGQFQYGARNKGYTLAALDGAAFAVGAYALYRTEGLKKSGSFLGGGKYATQADRDAAAQSMNVYLIGFGLFTALWAYGAYDGLKHVDDVAPRSPPLGLVPLPGGLGVVGQFP